MLAFEISRLYFILYHHSSIQESILQVFVVTAASGFFLDVSTVAYCMAPILLLIFTEGLIRRKLPDWFYGFFIILDFISLFLITISDPELYRQWGGKFNNQVLVYISHPKEMAISSGSVQWAKTILFSIVLLIAFVLIAYAIIKIFTKERKYSIQYSLTDLFIIILSFVMLRGGVGVATISQSSAIYSDNQLYNSAAINSLWNAIYYIFNDVGSLYDERYYVFEDEKAKKEFDERLVNGDSCFIDLTTKEQPNIMIIMLESFTASGSKHLEGHFDLMPNLDAIARENLCFDNCYASGDRTEKGLVAVLSGYPAQPASSIIVFPDKCSKLNSLGKVLAKKGYSNSFIYGGDAEFASMKAYLLMNKIDNIVDKRNFKSDELNSKWGAHDGNLYNKVIDMHKSMKSPFFSTVLSLSSHEPFDVPYSSSDIPKDEWYGFKNSLRYADHCLNEFLKECEKQPWYDNTLIFLVADHGHDIGLANIWFFGREKFHIPLIVTGGALDAQLKGTHVSKVISQTAIPSLLLKSIGLEDGEFRWQTDACGKSSFAQYHYNSGFGRVTDSSFCVFDNLARTFYYSGDIKDSAQLKRDGLIYQQILVKDFIGK